MSVQLFAHPFSSYCQKVLMALYENDTRFELRMLGPEEPATAEEFARLWPIKRFPLLLHEGRTIAESSIIIEYLDRRFPGRVRFIPADADAALECRFMDRFFDNYIMTPTQRIVFDAMRPADARDAATVADARSQLEVAYAWLDARMKDREWAAGASLGLADCAAAPSLFYADWTHRIDPRFTHVHAYRRRLLARPSFARAVDEARPYRSYFPPGAPDRD